MIFSAARYDIVTISNKRGGHRLGIFHDLLLIGLKLRFQRLFEGHGFGRNDMHQWPALAAREYH